MQSILATTQYLRKILKPLPMHRASKLAAFLAFLLLTLSNESLSQSCRMAPPLDSCDGSGPAVANNEILTAGVKKWFYGPAATFNQLTLRGGTLVVCGNLTISNGLIMDSGTIVIRPNAKLTGGGVGGSGMIWTGGSAVYNYGTFNVTSNLTLEGPYATAARPNIVMNVTPASVMKVTSNYFVINSANSMFINNGAADMGGLITDGNSTAGSVCLGPASSMVMSILINKVKNTYTAPYGHGCVQVTSYTDFQDSLASNPGVLACVKSGVTTATGSGKKPNAWGRAQVFSSCSVCGALALLPVYVTNFRASNFQKGYTLSWNTDMVDNNYLFAIERSADGIKFNTIDSFLSTGGMSYTRQDMYAPGGYLYYRLRYWDVNARQVLYSTIVKVYSDEQTAGVELFPNPFYAAIRINWQPGQQPKAVMITGSAGNVIYYQALLHRTDPGVALPLPSSLPAGNYIVKLIYPGKVVVRKIVKALN
jgi:hypothetical protein